MQWTATLEEDRPWIIPVKLGQNPKWFEEIVLGCMHGRTHAQRTKC